MTAPLFSATPVGAPRGGIIVIQEAFGMTPHLQDVCRRLAAAGWYAVAPHLFHRSGDPVLSYDDLPATAEHLGQLTAENITLDVDDALEALGVAGIGMERTAIVGFCMGGTIALAMAAVHPLAAAVTFYGSGIRTGRFGFPPLVEIAPALRAPWLGLYGDEDGGIPVEQVEDLRAAAARAAVRTEVVRYPEAGHGFNCDARASYVPAVAADAWDRVLAWIDAAVPPR